MFKEYSYETQSTVSRTTVYGTYCVQLHAVRSREEKGEEFVEASGKEGIRLVATTG
ncbi:hypothetical protein WH47_02992 [Habropoda laboriosa]|uniref:Uncharacterized protein n=1 Tax=Habropoda laboriosa TaxID=597456 RepID=A0A0L7QSY6_9HYME|nr:hypothetical protein WH47_02992 [Habropoda laboriosa]